jgi:hypothetical protein
MPNTFDQTKLEFLQWLASGSPAFTQFHSLTAFINRRNLYPNAATIATAILEVDKLGPKDGQ